MLIPKITYRRLVDWLFSQEGISGERRIQKNKTNLWVWRLSCSLRFSCILINACLSDGVLLLHVRVTFGVIIKCHKTTPKNERTKSSYCLSLTRLWIYLILLAFSHYRYGRFNFFYLQLRRDWILEEFLGATLNNFVNVSSTKFFFPRCRILPGTSLMVIEACGIHTKFKRRFKTWRHKWKKNI